MVRYNKRSTKLLLHMILLYTFLFHVTVFTYSTDNEREQAITAIDQTTDMLTSAYIALLKAEGAGANVVELVNKLNDANKLLDQAETALNMGDYVNVFQFTDSSFEISEEVEAQANYLSSVAGMQAHWNFMSTIVLSIGLMGMTALTSIIGWKIFKGYYNRRLKMKARRITNDDRRL